MLIDFAAARNTLVSIVKSVGTDHIGTKDGNPGSGCQYADNDANGFLVPSCIVGYVFAFYGILGLTRSNGLIEEGTCHIDNGMWLRAAAAGYEFSDEAKRFLKLVQEKQDSGKPWGECVNVALTEFRETLLSEFKGENPDVFWDSANRALLNLGLAPWERDLIGV